MKDHIRMDVARHLLVAFVGLSFLEPGHAEGIPEPSLILYGTVRNTALYHERVSWGTLTWRFRSESTGRTAVFTAKVGNVLDQFSYVLEVPCEQIISANVSSNVLNLSGTPVSFDRSQVFYGGFPASFAVPAQSNIVLSARNRGAIERVDLLISVDCEDWDGNGLCDDWELYYLGYIGVDPNDDPDQDGMSNLDEFKAGTDPWDFQSAFRFISCARMDSTRMWVEWQSADGRSYSLLSYPSLLSTNYTVVRSNIFATTARTSWIDTNAGPDQIYFYRVLLEP